MAKLWFPFAYLVIVVGLWFTLSMVFRAKCCPPRYKHLPMPPRFIIPLTSWLAQVLYGLRSATVATVFKSRLRSRWFRWKVAAYGLYIAAPHIEFTRSLGARWRRGRRVVWRELLRRLVGCRCYRIRPRFPFLVGGYAGTTGRGSDWLMLGLAPWVLGKGPLTSSAADHELLHCIQESFRGILQREWKGPSWGERLWWESHACLIGSPLLSAVALTILGWPFALLLGG